MGIISRILAMRGNLLAEIADIEYDLLPRQANLFAPDGNPGLTDYDAGRRDALRRLATELEIVLRQEGLLGEEGE